MAIRGKKDDNKKKGSKIEEAAKKTCETNELSEVSEWGQTGCTVLDLAISNVFPGGIPIGRIVTFYGGMSTCKSVLAATILGYAQRSGKIAHYGDVEHTLDERFSRIYGYEPNDSIVSYPNNLEEMFDDWIAGAIYIDQKKKTLNTKPKIMIVDSVSALPAKIEADKRMDEGQSRAPRAKQLSLGFRKYIKALSESNSTLVFVDQTRVNMASAFGGECVSGGKAPEFYPSVRVYLKHDGKVINRSEKVIGIWTKFKVTKNKVGPPFREGRFKILFDYGLDDIASNLHFLSEVQSGKDAAKKKLTKIDLFGQQHKMSWWIDYIEKENKEEELRKETYRVWKIAHTPEKRKTRHYV